MFFKTSKRLLCMEAAVKIYVPVFNSYSNISFRLPTPYWHLTTIAAAAYFVHRGHISSKRLQRAYRTIIAVFSVRYDHPRKDRRYDHKKEVVGVIMAQIADRLAGFSLRRMHKRENTAFPKHSKPFP